MFFAMQKTDFTCLSFFAEKVILELNCTITSLASKNTNSVFSATKQIMRMRATNAQKPLSQSEKVAKCNLRAKFNYMNNYSF